MDVVVVASIIPPEGKRSINSGTAVPIVDRQTASVVPKSPLQKPLVGFAKESLSLRNPYFYDKQAGLQPFDVQT